jgi:hypothetical protein
MKFKPGQGKTQKQYEDSAKIAWYGVVGMAILIVILTLFSNCATTKVDKCCKNSDEIIEHYETK